MKTRISIPGVRALRQHLNRFAIATILTGAGLLAVAWPAYAQIIYTPVNITIETGRRYILDLNNDGVTDFTISVGGFNLHDCEYGCTAFVHEKPAKGNGAEGSPPAELMEGDPIGPSQAFYGGIAPLGRL